jgi:DNA topoisomerase-6 subunit B
VHQRYGIDNFEEQPVSVFVNVSSVYIPYSGVGKQAIAQEEEIIDEIKLAVQDCGRALQKHISGMKNKNLRETRYSALMRYVDQMSNDLADITGSKKEEIKGALSMLIEKRFKPDGGDAEGGEEEPSGSPGKEGKAGSATAEDTDDEE